MPTLAHLCYCMQPLSSSEGPHHGLRFQSESQTLDRCDWANGVVQAEEQDSVCLTEAIASDVRTRRAQNSCMLSPCAAPRWPDSKQRQLARSPHVRRFAPRAFSGEAGRKDVAADWAAAPDERSVPRRPQRTELERVQFQLNQAQEPGQAAARLARYLHRCSTWQDLAVAWAQVGPQMNAVHLAALLVRAAKLPAPGYRDGNDLLVFNT